LEPFRIALANLRIASSPEESVPLATPSHRAGWRVFRQGPVAFRHRHLLSAHGREGLLLADRDLSLATGVLASRCR